MFFVDSWKQKTRSGRLQEPCTEGSEYAGPDSGDIVSWQLLTSANTVAIVERWAGPPGCARAGGERAEAQSSGVRQTGAGCRMVTPLLQTIVEPKYYLIIILLNVLGRDHEVADGRIVPVTNKPRQTFEGIRSCSGR